MINSIRTVIMMQVQHGFNVGGFFVWNVGEDDKVIVILYTHVY